MASVYVLVIKYQAERGISPSDRQSIVFIGLSLDQLAESRDEDRRAEATDIDLQLC